jgi:hypothetical protein
VDTTKIGLNHIQHGEKVLSTDTTGKSLIGQQYIWILKEWLNDNIKSASSNKLPQKAWTTDHKMARGQAS